MGTLPDRRRLNGPLGGTEPPVIVPTSTAKTNNGQQPRSRLPGELRKIFIKTGFVPSASGSAFYEVQPSQRPSATGTPSSLKLICSVHGPRPLPRSAPFSPQLVLSTRFKFAPCATVERRSYLPDHTERDLSGHLEIALRGAIVAERWPKSGLDVIITVLEGDDEPQDRGIQTLSTLSLMNVLAGSINAASAAIAEAGIDCVDVATGGVAAIVTRSDGQAQVVLDPCPSDDEAIEGLCLVSYLKSRGEITDFWATAAPSARLAQSANEIDFDTLGNNAIEAASGARLVVIEALTQAATEAKTMSKS